MLPHPRTGRPFPSPVPPGSGWPGDTATAQTPVARSAAGVRRLARGAASLAELDAEISVCRACPRLVAWREEVAVTKRRSYAGEPYWGRPVPGWGSERPRVLILGLAPAANGANRTGRVFTGDRSGDPQLEQRIAALEARAEEQEATLRRVIAEAAKAVPGITVEVKRMLLARALTPLPGNAPLVAALWWLGPALFTWAFGPDWADAGLLARALAVYIGLHFIASPLGVVTMAWQAQAWALKLALVGQAVFVAALAGGLAWGGLAGAGWAVSGAMALYFGWYFSRLATWPLDVLPAAPAAAGGAP